MNKLHIYLRQNVQINQKKLSVRPDWFSYQHCYDALVKGLSGGHETTLTIFLDGGTRAEHHVKFHQFSLGEPPVVLELSGGSDAASLLNMLMHVKSRTDVHDDDIVYLVEDDYLHRHRWDSYLRDGIAVNPRGYVTLYDHPDKYFLPMYRLLTAKLLPGQTGYWRTTPSTTNTYAMKAGVLRQDFEIHRRYCLPEVTHDGYDHTKFLELGRMGRTLISPIYSVSTHCEREFMAKFINWETI